MAIVLAELEDLISSSRDEVAVYDSSFTQVFPKARILKGSVNRPKRVMRHPLENGATTVDHVIIDPIEIELSMLLTSKNYQDTYNQIVGYFIDSTLLIVQTRASTYFNQVISAMPHVEDTRQYNTITIAVKFTQVQFAATESTTVPANPSNSSTVDRGAQQPQNVSASKQSSYLLYLGRLII